MDENEKSSVLIKLIVSGTGLYVSEVSKKIKEFEEAMERLNDMYSEDTRVANAFEELLLLERITIIPKPLKTHVIPKNKRYNNVNIMGTQTQNLKPIRNLAYQKRVY